MDVCSYISDKVEKRRSEFSGYGLFAIEPIKKGAIVCVKGGHILKKENIYSSAVINSYHPISDELFLAASTPQEEEQVKIYINHSCDPNCGIRGEITFVAMRDIQKDEEITFDYAFLDNEDYEFICNCGTEKCRHIVTGYDWKREELQEQYYQYFAIYLKEKIDLMRRAKH